VVMRVCVSVCLSAAACPHYCTDPDVTWGSCRGCPVVVHYRADLQSVRGMRCYGNIMEMRGRAQGNPPDPAHAARTHTRTSDKIDAPAACASLSATKPFHFVHTARVAMRTRNVSEYMLVLALCLVLCMVFNGCSLSAIEINQRLTD